MRLHSMRLDQFVKPARIMAKDVPLPGAKKKTAQPMQQDEQNENQTPNCEERAMQRRFVPASPVGVHEVSHAVQ